MIFDLLVIDGEDIAPRPYRERRSLLDSLGLIGPSWITPEPFEDCEALWSAVCEHGLEGTVAKRRNGLYRPSRRGWIKVKNPD